MFDLICLGELLIDFVPNAEGRKLRDVSTFKKTPGGAPANVAAGFSRLGGRAALISKTGNDEFGSYLQATLEKVGVDTAFLYKTSEALTGLAFVSLQTADEPSYMFYRNPSADMLLHPDEINEEMFRNARIFHYGSVSLISSPAREATLKAAQLASKKGLLVSYDPNFRPALWPEPDNARIEILNALPWADILKVSISELEFLTGFSESKGVNTLFKGYPRLKLIIVTAGKKGAGLYLVNRKIEVPAYSVDSVDPTGAGDGFTAAILYKINHSLKIGSEPASSLWSAPLEFWYDAGLFACAAGALVVGKRGAISSMPTLREVEKMIG